LVERGRRGWRGRRGKNDEPACRGCGEENVHNLMQDPTLFDHTGVSVIV
jgi:hypothetical protein